jgi:hypothetical protein
MHQLILLELRNMKLYENSSWVTEFFLAGSGADVVANVGNLT